MEGYTKLASEILSDAADLVARPGGWTQRSVAKDRDGLSVEVESPAACSFCLIGALDRASIGCTPARMLLAAELALTELIDSDSLATWNDASERTQEEVVAALRAASAKLKAESL
jgi:hypothetical protein